MLDATRQPAWPERLLELARCFDNPDDAEARGSFWLLLNLALNQRLRLHSRRLGPIEPERIRDLASQKAFDLVGKIDCGRWSPLDSSAGELVNFISAVARNALVDELRRSGRQQAERFEDDLDRHRPSQWQPDAPGVSAERKEFIESLMACAERLEARHRLIWSFRVLYEMPAASIARHPDVLLKPGHVDMILGRCRDRIRKCMRSKGLDTRELPPGTFTELWKSYRMKHRTEASHDGE